MTRGTLIPIASLVMAIGATGLNATDRALAAEPQIAGMKVTSSDANSRFMALGVSKSVVIDFPTDIQDVLVTDKGVVNAIIRTKRRAYILGEALGQTNVYFFDADGRQIGALDVAVTATSLPAALEDYPFPANVVLLYSGTGSIVTLSCTSKPATSAQRGDSLCIDASKPGAKEVPGTQNINVTGSTSTVAVSPK